MEFDIFGLINSVGFPITVCAYLLVENKKKDERLLKVIDNNTKALTEFNTHWRGNK